MIDEARKTLKKYIKNCDIKKHFRSMIPQFVPRGGVPIIERRKQRENGANAHGGTAEQTKNRKERRDGEINDDGARWIQ